MARAFTEEMEQTPVLEDALLDQLGDMWATEDKKKFPTFLAYLNYQVYETDRARVRRVRRREEKEFRIRKALRASRGHRES